MAQRLILHTIAENPGNIKVTDKDKLRLVSLLMEPGKKEDTPQKWVLYL